MTSTGADVRVIGVGGGGGNALKRLSEAHALGATFIAVNTDARALEEHPADRCVVLGHRTTRGLGAGGQPSVGLAAARESSPELLEAIEGADMVFVAAGLGGGTGTGAAPLVAHLARRAGALVVGVVTVPFAFEGMRRRRLALDGLDALEEQVDSLLVIENDRLLELDGPDPSVVEAFSRADTVLCDGVRGIGDLVTRSGLINLDFADVRAVLTDGGRAVMGVGAGHGPERAMQAVQRACASPLLEDDCIEGARGVLLAFRADPRIGLNAIHRAAARIQAEVDDEAEILFGVTIDETLHDEVRVTLVAAGLSPGQPVEEAAEIAEPRRRNALVMLEQAAPSRTRRFV